MKKILWIPLNILTLLLCWVILTWFNVISPQFQMRPVAELTSKIRQMEPYSVAAAYMEDGWVSQGQDYMLWDKLTGFFGSDDGEAER